MYELPMAGAAKKRPAAVSSGRGLDKPGSNGQASIQSICERKSALLDVLAILEICQIILRSLGAGLARQLYALGTKILQQHISSLVIALERMRL